MFEILFFFIILLIVSIFSNRISKLPISFQMIFIIVGIFTGWLVTGYVDVTKPPISKYSIFNSGDSLGNCFIY